MATTQIADIYNPLVFNPAVDEAAVELNAFLQSGVLVSSPILDNMASVGGNIGELPFHQPLDVSIEPNYSTDDPAVDSIPDKITTEKMIYRLASMNNSWSTMDIARELALMDPLTAITSKIGKWWATQIERRVIQSAMGVLNDNVVSNAGDMLVDIATDAAGAPTVDELISADAVINTKQTMGDHAGSLAVIAVHSVVYSNLQKQNLIDFIPNARGEVNIPTYLGYRVVVDDSMPAVAGANRITYTTILFSSGAFDNGQGMVATPSELARSASAGNGGGQDVVHSRKSEIIHPYGYQFTSVSVAGQSATLTELAASANWGRVVDRKQVGIAFLNTNG